MGKIRIASLNIWGYRDWQARLPLIAELLKKTDADVILLQEVQHDRKTHDVDQATGIGRALAYPHSHFEVACVKTSKKGVPLPNPVDHGLGIISRFPFKTSSFKLKQAEGDPEPRIIVTASVETPSGIFSVTNVHFANKDGWDLDHFKETLAHVRKHAMLPILAGDFNIKDFASYKELYARDYTAASELYSYVSYPADGLSYDQILIPKNMTFESFTCFDESVSDHRLITADIKRAD